LQGQDEEDEIDFYARRGIKRKPQFRDHNRRRDQVDEKDDQKDGTDSKKRDHHQTEEDSPDKKTNPLSSPPPVHGDEINFSLIPEKTVHKNTQFMPPLDLPLLRTSGRLKVIQLKKYLLKKIEARCILYHGRNIM